MVIKSIAPVVVFMFSLILPPFFQSVVFAEYYSRNKAIEASIVIAELEKASVDSLYSESNVPLINSEEGWIDMPVEKTDFQEADIKDNVAYEEGFSENLSMAEDLYLDFGLNIGFMKGYTSYDFSNHVSELEFPFNNYFLEGNLSLGFKDLSLNTSILTDISRNAGLRMKDKDWNSSGEMTSYTKSNSKTDILVWDINLQYDFFKQKFPKDIDLLVLSKEDQVKIGFLAGYKQSRFDFDLYDLYYPDYDIWLYDNGTKVGTYQIKYQLPYVGLATSIENPKYGLGLSLKYSFDARAQDIDNHLLRGLTFYGDYKKHGQAYIVGVNTYWQIMKNLKWRLGAEGTFIRIDGITWEESRDPVWDANQNTDARYWTIQTGIEYRF